MTTAQVSVCVGVAPLQQSRERGQAAQWAVDAWTTGGKVPDVKLQLRATPSGAGTPSFSFGCGNGEGTALCDLGAVDATSAIRLLRAQLTVPVTATTVTSVSLTATGSAANLRTDPAASGAITILTPPTPIGVSPILSSGTFPGVTAPTLSPTLSPGGNASGLFPTVNPSSAAPHPSVTGHAEQVANTSALPAGSSTVGAQAVGLAALALAGVFAVTRISIRRPTPAAAPAKEDAAPPPKAPGKSDSEPKGPDESPATPEA